MGGDGVLGAELKLRRIGRNGFAATTRALGTPGLPKTLNHPKEGDDGALWRLESDTRRMTR